MRKGLQMSAAHKLKWEHYRDTRKGTYEFRAATRYAGAANRLFALGMTHAHSLCDVGAGSLQFGQYLHERGWRGRYAPVDAVLDGTDLETWAAPPADYFACIEVLEHVRNPYRLLLSMMASARRGVVITTPNPDVIDVINCDPTHVSEVHAFELESLGFIVERVSWFGTPEDTLLAWRSA
jgi:hypothetical protein